MRRSYPITRRHFTFGALSAFALAATGCSSAERRPAPTTEGESLGDVPEPAEIPKYLSPLVVPPPMPQAKASGDFDYYEIAMRQFEQQVLPEGFPKTTVWGYGSLTDDATFHAPSFTIEAKVDRPVRVKWVNELVNEKGEYLPHLLPVDQTLHWANPAMGAMQRDMEGTDPKPYTGPVPMVTHVHGAHTFEEYDGYPEAWYLPAATNIPQGTATVGSFYTDFAQKAADKQGEQWEEGSATFEYPNDTRASTLWYHDHAMGITRLNVYTGPAGFYLVRGGADDEPKTRDGAPAVLPGPAPEAAGDGPAFEIPLAIQDRSFNADASLKYPDNRAFFEGLEPERLKVPFIPERGCKGMSDIPPMWNPEFFGETIIVNGRTWPFLEVEPRRYRLRILNGCQSRFLMLMLEQGLIMWQIGNEGGFLDAPVRLEELLMGPAERADVIVDFSSLAPGTKVRMLNVGPDEPFGGMDFEPANPDTTGQVMEFRVVEATGEDESTPPEDLVLPERTPLPKAVKTRKVSLNEADSSSVRVVTEDDGSIVMDCEDEEAEPFGPVEALLGVVNDEGEGIPLSYDEEVTEIIKLGDTEVWEIHNFTMDAHPIHIHQVAFELLDRQDKKSGKKTKPEPWERGFKDTVIAYPDQITRVKATFDVAGTFVWHCHILEHEDNEMMRPFRVDE